MSPNLSCVVGGLGKVVETITTTGQQPMFDPGALPFAAGWFVVFFLTVHAVEWMDRKRPGKQSESNVRQS